MTRYLVAVDGSQPAAAALRWAAERADAAGDPLVIIHVEPGGIDSSGDDGPALQRGAELLAEAAASVSSRHPDLVVSVRLLEGSVPAALAAFAERTDTLVIGTGKTGFLHGRVLGSRGVQIAMAVPCTLAVIPDVDLRFRRGVVAGVDRQDTAAAIARAAALEADSRGEELLLVQAAQDRSTRLTTAARADLALGEAVASAREQFPELEIRSRVAARPPAEALLDSARDKALLVLGPGSADAEPPVIGSVLHDVLVNANAPVLIKRL